jgi:hypothetical protein
MLQFVRGWSHISDKILVLLLLGEQVEDDLKWPSYNRDEAWIDVIKKWEATLVYRTQAFLNETKTIASFPLIFDGKADYTGKAYIGWMLQLLAEQ